MTDDNDKKINFIEFAKRYYTYQNKKTNGTESNLNFIISALSEEGYDSQQYIYLLKKFFAVIFIHY